MSTTCFNRDDHLGALVFGLGAEIPRRVDGLLVFEPSLGPVDFSLEAELRRPLVLRYAAFDGVPTEAFPRAANATYR